MVHSRDLKFEGRSWRSEVAIRTGRVDVIVVQWARQACRKKEVVVGGMVRERKVPVFGWEIEPAVQKLCGV